MFPFFQAVRVMERENGGSLIGILIALVIILLFVFLTLPKLMRSDGQPNETAAIATLRMIHAAESDYYGAGRMYGSLGKLTNSKLLAGSFPEGGFKRDGYEFTHSTNGSGRVWCAAAVPEQGKTGRSFGIDESGAVYQDLRAASPCSMGTLDASGGSPLR